MEDSKRSVIVRTKWNKENVEGAIKSFFIAYHRYPTAKELDSIQSLPSHSRFQRWMGVPYSEYLESVCGTTLKNCNQQKQIETFKRWYMELRPIGFNDFEKRRPSECPKVRTIKNILGLKRWSDLITALNLPDFSRKVSAFIVEETGGLVDLLAEVQRLKEECKQMDEQFMQEGRAYYYLSKLYPDYHFSRKNNRR